VVLDHAPTELYHLLVFGLLLRQLTKLDLHQAALGSLLSKLLVLLRDGLGERRLGHEAHDCRRS
jgi:hypothetical protein